MNAFTESLAIELKPFNIRVGLVLPGRAPATRFGENAQRIMGDIPAEYAELSQQIFNEMRNDSSRVTYPIDVAKAVWHVVNDPNAPMRLPAGEDALYMAGTN